MKLSKTLLSLLFTIAFTISLAASARAQGTGVILTSACGAQATWNVFFQNTDSNEAVTEIIFFVVDTSEYSLAPGSDSSSAWFNFPSSTGDTAFIQGPGLLPGQRLPSMYFTLNGEGENPLPLNLYDSSVTIYWESIVGGTQMVESGSIKVTPTLFQGNCTFDTATVTTSSQGCDPLFNFNVINKNGIQAPISNVEFALQGFGEAVMRPSDMQEPSGWQINNITENTVDFYTTTNPIQPGGNLSGFVVGLSAQSSATEFSFAQWNYSGSGQIGGSGLIDRDTINNISAKAQPCSQNPSSDTVTVQNNGDCEFTFGVKNYHNATSGNAVVSPLSEYSFTIITPGLKWSNFEPPREAPNGSWELTFGPDSTSVRTDLRASFRKNGDSVWAQPSGVIWHPNGELSSDIGTKVIIAWSDSNFTGFVSSGFDTIECSNKNPDSVALATVIPTNCSYSVTLFNKHDHITSSIHAVALDIPPTAGKFGTDCESASNNWTSRLSNGLTFTAGTSPAIATGSSATFNFCIDPGSLNSPWTLTVFPLDSLGDVIDTVTLNVPGCTPPVVCDSVLFAKVPDSPCSFLFTIFNRRLGGEAIDTFTVTPMNGHTVDSAPVNIQWKRTIAPDGTSATYFGDLVASQAFAISFAGAADSFPVQVTTLANGQSCTTIDTIACISSGVSEPTSATPFDVTVIPNPMTDQANITLTTGAFDRVQMMLFDVMGRNIQTVADGTISAGDHNYTLDVSALAPGTYYLRVQTTGGTITKKLSVEH